MMLRTVISKIYGYQQTKFNIPTVLFFSNDHSKTVVSLWILVASRCGAFIVFGPVLIYCCCLVGLFVCVEVLRPSQPIWVMSGVVNLPNHTFTGQS